MAEAIRLIGEVLWFFLPAFAANSAPVVAARFKWLPGLAIPLDQGRIWHGKRLLGDNKTLRGLIVGIVSGALISLLQYGLEKEGWVLSDLTIPMSWFEALGWGTLLGFGALLGDAVKSFFKRRFNIPPGKSWKPWDQIDMVVGVVLLSWYLVPLTLSHIIVALIIIGLGMWLISFLGVIFGIKKDI